VTGHQNTVVPPCGGPGCDDGAMFWRGIRRAGAGILAVLPGPVRRALRAFWAWPARRRVGLALILVLPLPWYFALHAPRVNDVLAGPTVTVSGVLVEVNHTSADRSPDTVVVAFRTCTCSRPGSGPSTPTCGDRRQRPSHLPPSGRD
jgi:hypothetical protein